MREALIRKCILKCAKRESLSCLRDWRKRRAKPLITERKLEERGSEKESGRKERAAIKESPSGRSPHFVSGRAGDRIWEKELQSSPKIKKRS